MAYSKKITLSVIVTASLIFMVVFALFALGFAKYAYQRGFNDGYYLNQSLKGASKYIK